MLSILRFFSLFTHCWTDRKATTINRKADGTRWVRWSGSTFVRCPTRVSLTSQVLISSKPAFLSTRIPNQASRGGVGVIVQGFNSTVEAVAWRPSLTKPWASQRFSFSDYPRPKPQVSNNIFSLYLYLTYLLKLCEQSYFLNFANPWKCFMNRNFYMKENVSSNLTLTFLTKQIGIIFEFVTLGCTLTDNHWYLLVQHFLLDI